MEDLLSSSLADLNIEESESVVEKAFSIHVIHQNIFGRLELDDLKSCRVVSKAFNVIASLFIKSRNCCRVQLMYGEYVCGGTLFGRNEKNSQEIHSEYTIGELNKILENDTNLPCTDFELGISERSKHTYESTCKENEITFNLGNFFTIFGRNIRTLTISLRFFSKHIEDFYAIIFDHAVNIQNLNLVEIKPAINRERGYDFDGTESQWSTLPNLKRLSWDDYCKIVGKILNNAPNLSEIEFTPTTSDVDSLRDSMDAVIASGKVSAIKKLNYNYRFIPIDVLRKFVQANPKLEEIKFYIYTDIPKLRTLIDSNANSLRYIDFSDFIAQWMQLPQFPRMPNLRKFSVGTSYFSNGSPMPCFPPRTDFLNTFPNLYCLDLSMLEKERYKKNLQCSFPIPNELIGNLPTVKVLKTSTDVTIRWMKRIRRYLCPNFNQLVIHVNLKAAREDLADMLKMVYIAWWHLEKIEIRGLSVGFCNLDSVLTGLTICNGSPPVIPNPRIRSLGCLRDLRKLTFVFSEVLKTQAGIPVIPMGLERLFLFSDITCQFIQEHMQLLDVNIMLNRHYKNRPDVDAGISSFKHFSFIRFLPILMPKEIPYSS